MKFPLVDRIGSAFKCLSEKYCKEAHMILYQYVSLDVGHSILRSNKVGFRQQSHFNDPFEAALTPVPPSINAERLIEQMSEHRGEISDEMKWMIRNSQTQMASGVVDMNCVSLCLSKDPLNPLMWAHYAHSDGMAIGFDVTTTFFRGLNNACPIQFGDVVYTRERPDPDYESDNVMPLDSWYYKPFDKKNLRRIQKTFLYKAIRWKYEKEVRVVKRLNESSEDGIREVGPKTGYRELFLYKLPGESVKRVYVIVHPMILHTYRLDPGIGGSKQLKKFRDFVTDEVRADLYAVTCSLDNWGFESEKL